MTRQPWRNIPFPIWLKVARQEINEILNIKSQNILLCLKLIKYCDTEDSNQYTSVMVVFKVGRAGKKSAWYSWL